ncbi:hypothetical protein JMG10_02465 [Nostoc ellipsosporum NOK]|nr:hypothetical protein [Nostoc ellipsosporum NOK]
MKIVMGVLIGILIMTVVTWLLKEPENAAATRLGRLYEMKEEKADIVYDEKIVAINKRLDDILIFGGIIITLLLGINAGVFVNAERQVESYMRRNYQVYLDQILADLKKADDMIGDVQRKINLNSPDQLTNTSGKKTEHEKQDKHSEHNG